MSVIDGILSFAGRHPALDGPMRELNRKLINHFATAVAPRPRSFSLWSPDPASKVGDPNYITDYTSWPSLTNKRYSGRHLAPADPAYTASLPNDAPYDFARPNVVGDVTKLFVRTGPMRTSRSSLLFMSFAQWFTDSILRVNFLDRRTNNSNHDIDLCSVYGLTEDSCRLLRSMTGGQLRSQMIRGEEYLDYLCNATTAPNGARVFSIKPQYAGLEVATVGLDAILVGFPNDRREKLYATGLERGNSSIGYVAISTIFMREHNRIAKALSAQNPAWDDERTFQTARNINIVILMKLVVEDYINHILGHHLFRLDHEFAEEQPWYRANWIALEFDMLYRWHGLAPDAVTVNGNALKPQEFRNNNALLEEVGVGPLIDSVSRQAAGKIGLANTPDYLWGAEYNVIKMARDFRVRPYNEYRELFGLNRMKSFSDLTSDTGIQHKLARLYGTVDNLELFIGLFAEEAGDGLLFGDLLNRMVAYDAFTQIFSNPLLSKNNYNKDTFTDYGLDLIEKTTSIEILVNRNVSRPVRASLAVIP